MRSGPPAWGSPHPAAGHVPMGVGAPRPQDAPTAAQTWRPSLYLITDTLPALDDLRAGLAGSVSVPGDDRYDEARLAWNLAVDQRPAAVAEPETVADVEAVVRYAGERGLRIAAQGTGHNAAPLGDLEGTILVKTHRLRDVHVDAHARRAVAMAGAVWADVVVPASRHGLVALAGSSHDVGVVGYTLGGGLSWLARSHGLAANAVVAIQVVTVDGVHRRVDETHEPELFWALRGGGGSFGVVTAIEFRLYPISEVYAGVLFFPLDRAAEVLEAWRQWLPSVPDSVTSIGRILRFPPAPELPPF